jgi:hypothetical protein
MNKAEFMNSVSRSFHKVGFQLKKHSPEILVVSGVVGTVASAVMACKATTKINLVLEETKKHVDIIHEGVDKGEVVGTLENGETGLVPYTEEDSKKDLTIVYAKAAVNVAKLYAPAVIIGGLSIAAILSGHNITRKRNIALAAAYATVDKGFKEYRSRVIERFGKELDRELKYGIKAKEVEEVVSNEDGTESIVKKTVNVIDPNLYSDYARMFDDGCVGWTKDPEYNLMFLKQQQRYANDLLKSRGYLFLNEVYDMLGIPRTKAGQVVGWIYDEKNPIGDNFVDFGIYNEDIVKARDFVNGYERTILLDFNVDGNIFDKFA